ncbi:MULTISPECIES: restriction endonuclease subunit S [unclassified Pseudomonas]|uniref:restriction endonuclease subunit S n=1 Tax=unclassified Pseudomonas TaxID=196821 RepID=UPI00244A0C68|nr:MULTISPECIES: restriction endonuclease subunit S [unclassified Pseudomonas]MDG9924461.1 restriction endonuclease subunit S [Pseudomonas sp. GD04045]MDH0035199.1 restriction endonuclease subunit S [Pseudomonas sp. GD04019]
MSGNKVTLPLGWTTTRVDRVGIVRLGRQRSPDKHTGEHATKYLRAANIKASGIDLTDILTMDFTPAERAIFRLRRGDILLTEASGSSSQVGRAAQWNGEIADCCYQNTIIRFRPHAVTPAYALTVFRYYAASGIFGRLARGVGIQHLGASRFAGLSFPLPPWEEQQRIATAVELRRQEIREADAHLRSALEHLGAQRSEVFAAAARGELVERSVSLHGHIEVSRTLSLMERQSDGRQESLFESPSATQPRAEVDASLPTGWISARIGELGEVRLGRQRSPEHHRGEHLRRYLRVANVLEDRVDVSEVHEMNFTPEEYEIYALREGDILLNEGQSIELVGRPAMFRRELDGVCFQNTLIRFRAGPAIYSEFALLVFLHYLHAGKFSAVARGSTNIAHLGLDRFRSMTMSVPPLEEQERIVKEARQRLSEVEEQTRAVSAAITRLSEMERELLAAAVAGELVPQQPGEESAEDLLARLGEPVEAVSLPSGKQTKTSNGGAMKRKSVKPSGKESATTLNELLQKAGRPLSLPELFALTGFDRDEPEHVESFYLALRAELNHTVRQVGGDAENAILERIADAP